MRLKPFVVAAGRGKVVIEHHHDGHDHVPDLRDRCAGLHGDAWLGCVASPVDFGRSVQVWVKKRLKADRFLHSYYVTTLKLPSKGALMACYDARGGAEVEQFRNDKSGFNTQILDPIS